MMRQSMVLRNEKMEEEEEEETREGLVGVTRRI